VGMTQSNLPIGMQIIGKAFGESDILAVAHDFEVHHEFKNMRPTI
jgi:aspartyl-tRNA(Asn)/glutamyl-tRNA(Gln) amidotransferase subunit A